MRSNPLLNELHCVSARLLLAGKLNFPCKRNDDRDAVLRQSLGVFRNPSESALTTGFMLERPEPRRKAADKDRVGSGNRSVSCSQWQLTAMGLSLTKVIQQYAFIGWHPSGAPGRASPNGCQPTKAESTTESGRLTICIFYGTYGRWSVTTLLTDAL